MIIEVKVPSVGESVTSGVVSAWHKKSGEFVNEGEPLFALETDKVSTDIVAEKSGVLETKVPEGQEVTIGEIIAVIDDSKQGAKQPKGEQPKRAQPEAKKKQDEPQQEAASVAAGADRGTPGSKPAARALSPAVRRIVEEEKLEPAKIPATGPDSRLTKADVLKAMENRGKPEPSEVAVTKAEEKIEPREAQPSHEARFTRKKMSPLRRKIAQQLVMAQHTAAILTTFNECDMSAVQELRRSKQDEFTKKHGVKLGLMSFFVKAAVEALKAVPVVNVPIDGDDLNQNNFHDNGVDVGTERRLAVPVMRHAHNQTID